MILDAPYWEGRYASKNTGWDIGDISTPIKVFVDGLSDKSLRVLIPGAGNGHEAIYMREKGFDKVTVLDWSVSALNNIKSASPDFPDDYLIKGDFFEHLGQYDLILEQTFFCAIDPKLREKYATKVAQLLKPQGRLVGLLFDAPLNEDHPPFGGHKEEYLSYFKPHFAIKTFERAYNSIDARKGRELFIQLIKP
ncbi:MAG: methyltransferase domain-containing protein [Flavobacteriaceae bacterium]|jgi:thiopurine S-methyltransferase|nr:methyltransferase domain-containing protein [Flavobacteriaceae bacterium]